jgi:hypothetical protein
MAKEKLTKAYHDEYLKKILAPEGTNFQHLTFKIKQDLIQAETSLENDDFLKGYSGFYDPTIADYFQGKIDPIQAKPSQENGDFEKEPSKDKAYCNKGVAERIASISHQTDGNPTANQHHRYSRKMIDKDVINGRGTGPNNHNEFFHVKVREKQDSYLNADAIEKTKIVQEIISWVKNRGGLFLEKEKESGKWYELSIKKINDKVRQALRELNPDGKMEGTKLKRKRE